MVDANATQESAGPVLGPADSARRAGLRRMRLVAGGLLVLAAVIFVLTHGHGGALGYVNGAAEAAMVGAIADWFAVTAIFRHPLGLRIPHTALIPRKKDQLGESLEEFVTENFLTSAVVGERLEAARIPARVGAWLAEPENAERVVREAAPAAQQVLDSVSDREVRAVLDDYLLPRLTQEPVSPVAGSLLDQVLADRTHHALVDLAVRELHTWLSANKGAVAGIIGARAPWWSPRWLDDTVTDRIYVELLNWVGEVRDTPEHPARRAVDDLLAQLARDLQHDAETMARTEALKARLLTHPGVADALVSLWGSARRTLTDALTEPDSALRRRLTVLICDAGVRLRDDPRLQAAAERRLAGAVDYVVTTHGRELSALISQTVAHWDGKEAARRIELQVGRDLQFIRINGTVVGGLVGLVLHALTQLL